MATAPKMPRDESLEILRRIEPTLTTLDDRTRKIDANVGHLEERMRKVETDMARLDGRLTELSSKTPTILQIVGATLSINAGILALGFGLARIIAR